MKKILILITAIIVASCSNNLENLNQNIKDPALVPGESLFTGAQKSLVDQMVVQNVNRNNTKLWAQYWQEVTYTDESNYDQTSRPIPGTHWSVLYKDVLKDLDEAKNIIAETSSATDPDYEANKPNKLAIIEILNIYTYSILVETFGNIPYTESLDINNLTPKYDDGETIYKDLIDRLTTSINNLDVSKGSFGSADRIYNGDVTKWKKFAASLKLRMGILLSDVDNSFAKTAVESAVTSGVFESNDDNANYQYMSAAPNTNPIYDNLVLSGRHDYVAATTIIETMQPRQYEYLTDTNDDGVINNEDDRTVIPGSVTYTDPRMKYYFASNVDADPSIPQVVYLGLEIGKDGSFSKHTQISSLIQQPTFPGKLLDYAEVQFLLAEAAARNFNVGDTAENFYKSGVTASIEDWGGSASDATTYLALPTIDYTTALAASTATIPWKEVIGTQKWIALFNRGFEAWTSIRLLDYPKMQAAFDPLSGYPTRYTYPVVEQTLNGTNWEAASSAIGGDEPETKLFWDMY